MRNIKYILLLLIVFFVNVVEAAGGIELSETSLNVKKGSTSQIEITATNCAGKVQIVSTDTSILSVDTDEYFFDTSLNENIVVVNVVALKEGTANIEVRLVDVATFQYEELTGTKICTFNVSEELIEINGTKKIYINEEKQFTITGNSDKTIIWSSNNTDIATVSESGIVKGIGVGKTKIIARIEDNENLYSEYEIEVINNVINDVPKTGINKNIVIYISFAIMVIAAGIIIHYSYKKQHNY